MLTVLVFAVAILYGAFYYAYMPLEVSGTSPMVPFNLEFEPCEGSTVHRCSFLSASSQISGRQQMMHGQSYRIGLYLELPDYPVNEEIGMFMVCMKITGQMNSYEKRV